MVKISEEGSCVSTLSIHEDALKSGNLHHEQGFINSQFGTTTVATILVSTMATIIEMVFTIDSSIQISLHLL